MEYIFYNVEAVAIPNSHYGGGNGPIYLERLACDGSEATILDCLASNFHICSHVDDAAVRCQGNVAKGVFHS